MIQKMDRLTYTTLRIFFLFKTTYTNDLYKLFCTLIQTFDSYDMTTLITLIILFHNAKVRHAVARAFSDLIPASGAS